MPEKPLKDKLLQIRGFGDSLYVPLTKFIKKLDLKKDDIIKVSYREDKKEIVIKRPSSDDS